MIFKKGPELSPEEKKLPLAKYYDIPLTPLGPLYQQILDYGCPLDPKLAIKAENMLDLLKTTGYEKQEFGYCMMEDGTGYIAIYTTYPNCTPEMMSWWFRWLNVYPKDLPKGKGNLKYKIWCPPDHYDHDFINGKDNKDGIWTVESFDFGAGEPKVGTIRHPFNLRDYGLTAEEGEGAKGSRMLDRSRLCHLPYCGSIPYTGYVPYTITRHLFELNAIPYEPAGHNGKDLPHVGRVHCERRQGR